MDNTKTPARATEESEPKHEHAKEQASSHKDKLNKKKWWIAGGLGLLCVCLLIAVFQSTDEDLQQKQAAEQQAAAKQGQSQTSEKGGYNPLIDKKDLETIKNIQRKQFEDAGKPLPPEPTYEFQYEVSDSVKEKSSFLQVPQTYAATSCTLSALPQTVTVYTFRSHISLSEAQTAASQFEMTSDPASVPSLDNGSYQYYFTDAKVSKYLTISEPSLVYTYHHALTDASGSAAITQGEAKSRADMEMTKHNLLANTTATLHPADKGYYNVDYRKNYSDLTVIDDSSLDSLAGGSICAIKPAVQMGSSEVLITKTGNVNKLINNTREITKTYSLPRQDLEASVKEYAANPPVQPRVTGNASSHDKVTIEEVTLAYYDYGEQYPQVSYVPMYVVRGKAANGGTVTAVFPAISKENLDKTPVSKLVNKKESLQLETFNPPPPPPTIPVSTSTATGDTPKSSVPGGLCFGGMVDTIVTCTAPSGGVACSKDLEAKEDPYGACQKGCVNASEVVTVQAGQNACSEFLKQKGINDNGMSSPDIGLPGSSSKEAGSYTCKINACAC